MSRKPTEDAERAFKYSKLAAKTATDVFNKDTLTAAQTNLGFFDLGVAIHRIAEGLDHLSVGLRATYQLLEEIKQQADRQAQLLAKRP